MSKYKRAAAIQPRVKSTDTQCQVMRLLPTSKKRGVNTASCTVLDLMSGEILAVRVTEQRQVGASRRV